MTIVKYNAKNNEILSEKEMLHILTKIATPNAPLILTELVHFNSKYKQNHNVYLASLNNGTIMSYDGTKFVASNKAQFIDTMYANKCTHILKSIDDYKDKMPYYKIRAFDRWSKLDEKDAVHIKYKKELGYLLYNMKKIVLDTHKNNNSENKNDIEIPNYDQNTNNVENTNNTKITNNMKFLNKNIKKIKNIKKNIEFYCSNNNYSDDDCSGDICFGDDCSGDDYFGNEYIIDDYLSDN